MRESKWNMYAGGMQEHKNVCHTAFDINHIVSIKELIPVRTHKKILNIGAGEGMESSFLKELGYNVTAIVRGKENMEWATNKYPGITFIDCDMHDLPFPSNTFDAIYMDQVFEHAYSPFIFLLECYCVLRLGGLMFSRTPCFKERTSANNPSTMEAEYISHHHPNILPSNVYRQMYEKTGFEVLLDSDSQFLVKKGPEKNLHSDLHEIIRRRDLI